MTDREACMKLYRHEKIDYIPNLDAHSNLLFMDPLEHGCGFFDKQNEVYTDIFGVKWLLHGEGSIPVPGEYRLKDITRFREEKVIPTDEQIDAFAWDELIAGFTHSPMWDEENKINRVLLPAGFFERLHHLMGMEEAMIALIEEPEAVAEFNKEMVRYKKRVLDNLCSRIRVDVLMFMDDYGNGKNMFMSRDMWLELYFEPLKEIVAYTKSKGVAFELHSDGYITPIVGDIVEAGVDATNPMEGINDIGMIAEKYSDRLLIIGGQLGTQIPYASEERMREIVKTACAQLAHTGAWFPDFFVPGLAPEKIKLLVGCYMEELGRLGYQCR